MTIIRQRKNQNSIHLIHGTVIFFLAISFTAMSQTTKCNPKDETAIRKVINEFNHAWAEKNLKKYMVFFAEDADWENAFGGRRNGSKEIEKLYSNLITQFSTAKEIITDIKIGCISPNIALVDIYQTIEGQKLPKSGRIVPPRHIRITQIYKKLNSNWRIKVHRVADLREMKENNNINTADTTQKI